MRENEAIREPDTEHLLSLRSSRASLVLQFPQCVLLSTPKAFIPAAAMSHRCYGRTLDVFPAPQPALLESSPFITTKIVLQPTGTYVFVLLQPLARIPHLPMHPSGFGISSIQPSDAFQPILILMLSDSTLASGTWKVLSLPEVLLTLHPC